MCPSHGERRNVECAMRHKNISPADATDRHRNHAGCLSTTQIAPPVRRIGTDISQAERDVENVECGMWDVGCEMWDVGCGMWNVAMRHENISPTDRHSSGIASLNRINGKGNASYQHCPSVTTLTFSISILGVKHYVW